ncbi:hypothetical protein AAHA92_19427 [Salvia divinorum]|uniref:Agglutinin domain-containing protein n=1 Tax=Salvia divinorum TaxID=28513 RepID=A0ABD1H9J1_SALDI
MGMWALPKAIAIKSQDFKDRGHIYRKDDNGAVALGEEDVFSTKARIEVEQAKTDSKYVNLRFSYTNRYMHRTSDGSWAMAAVSTKPQEDMSEPSCTLFEPVKVDDDGVFYLIHAQSGGRLVVDSASLLFYVDFDLFSTTQGYLSAVDLDSLVRLPTRVTVAFIGDNAKYLKAFDYLNTYYLQFSSDVPYDTLSRHQVAQMPDGHVRLTSIHWIKLWRLASDDWVLADTKDEKDADTLFWPVKIDDSTVALQAANGKFCQRRVAKGLMTGSLAAVASSPTKEAGMQVNEMVVLSAIHNVRYQTEYARIYNEAPYKAWSTTVVNDSDEEESMAVSFNYQDSWDYTFARSFKLDTGVPAVIDAAVPIIGKEGSIDQKSYRINAPLHWNASKAITTVVPARGMVRVPAKSSVEVSYVGTRGTCNIPFYYSQVNNVVIFPPNVMPMLDVFEGVDGIYTVTNVYDFRFVVEAH